MRETGCATRLTVFACLCFREEQEEQEEDVLAAMEAGVGAPLLLWDVGGNSDHLQKCGLLISLSKVLSSDRGLGLNIKTGTAVLGSRS